MIENEKNQEGARVFPLEGLIFPVSAAVALLEGYIPEDEKVFKNTQVYLIEAFREGVHIDLSMGQMNNSQSDNFERRLEAVCLYAFTDLTKEEIGRIQEVTVQAINQKFDRGLVELHRASSSHLRDKYPLEHLGTRKPKSEMLRKSESRTRGGKYAEVVELVEKGSTAEEIMKITETNAEYLGRLRNRNKEIGLKIPYSKRTILTPPFKKELVKLENPDTSDDMKHELLDKLTISQRAIKSPSFTLLSRVINNLGLNSEGIVSTDCLNVLRENSIPFKEVEYRLKNGYTQRYVFIARADVEIIEEILLADPSLS